jgi:hypothetical protein
MKLASLRDAAPQGRLIQHGHSMFGKIDHQVLRSA